MASLKERAQVFGRSRNLIGIITERSEGSAPAPPVILLNAGIIHRVGPSRVAVELARRLASAGHRVLRFDLSGIGDSAPSTDVDSLANVVRADIAAAIDLMHAQETPGVVLFGICSGADNAFYVAADDPRVVGLVLVDPTIHSTRRFRVRRTLGRIANMRSWWNVLSGRSVYLRLRRAAGRNVVPPPGYYGLLTLDREAAARRARSMSERGVRFLYVVTRDMHPVCNYPGQISDSFEGAIRAPLLRVEWRAEADHLLRRDVDREWLGDTIAAWLPSVAPARGDGR